MRWTYFLIRSLILVAILMAVGIIAVHGEDNGTIVMNTTAEDSMDASADVNITSEENATTANSTLTCSVSVCDTGCVVCSDSSCHDAGFVCTETYSIEKIFPENVSIGDTQLNILIKNTGNVILKQITIEFSGDGITTVEKMPLDILPVGEKDYTFTKIKASKEGKIDLVMKILFNGTLKDTQVKQLNVISSGAQTPTSTEGQNAINVTELNIKFNSMKEAYADVDNRYQAKLLEGFDLKTTEDCLEEANRYIKEAQSYLVDEDYKKLKLALDVVEYNLLSVNKTLEMLPATGINATEISGRIDKQKEKYIELEQDYQNKKLQQYYVDMVYDKLKETKESMKEVESLMLDKEYKKVDYLLASIDESMAQIETELDNARGMTFVDKLKQNMLLIGSIAAALVSIGTAYSLIRRSINKDNMKELHDRLKSLEKGKKTDDKKTETKSEVKAGDKDANSSKDAKNNQGSDKTAANEEKKESNKES